MSDTPFDTTEFEPSKDSSAKKIIVGSEEWCAFPQLGIPAIAARIDSGARTSSIHAFNIQPFTRKGNAWVSFEVHPVQDNRGLLVRCEAPVHDRRNVKSSSGVAEKRYVIQTVMRLWDHEFTVQLTLANRDSMGFRMLLGREAMVGRILVDPELSFCLGQVSPATLEQHYKDARRSADGLRIGLLARSEKFYTNRRLIEACEERGHFPSLLDVRQCYLTLNSARGEIYEKERGIVQPFDVALCRCAIEDTLFAAGLLRQYTMNGGVAFNHPKALLFARDKVALFQKMAANEIPLCTFGFAAVTDHLQEMVHKVGVGPYKIQRSRDFNFEPSIAVNSSEETQILQNAWQGSKYGVQVLSTMGQIGTEKMKVLVIGGRIASVLKSDGVKAGKVKTSPSDYQIFDLNKDDKKLVQKIARLTGLSFLCVELLSGQNDDHDYFLSDVIPSPSIEVFEKATGKDLASQVVIEIERCCDWQRQ